MQAFAHIIIIIDIYRGTCARAENKSLFHKTSPDLISKCKTQWLFELKSYQILTRKITK